GPTGDLLELGAEGAPSLLRFAPVEEGVVALQEVLIHEDEEGAFFLATLGALMVRYGGDLEAQVSDGEQGAARPRPLRIVRGVTDYPGLSTRAAAAHLSQATHDAGSVADAGQGPGAGPQAPGAANPGEGDSAARAQASALEEKELHELLDRAEAHWAEYQRLKGQRRG
ncbi:MAG TPA: hypothetical protein VFO83_13930, partial [Aggregicoccus sp.]|nr:hypothetical protein [Aggregicoccus sp.]